MPDPDQSRTLDPACSQGEAVDGVLHPPSCLVLQQKVAPRTLVRAHGHRSLVGRSLDQVQSPDQVQTQDPVHTQRQVETARRRSCLALLQGSVPVPGPGLMLQDQRDAELQPSLCRRDA